MGFFPTIRCMAFLYLGGGFAALVLYFGLGERFFSSYEIINLAYVDAVKRRTLPAWIREGLEKMEREKQKKLEKERMEQQRSQMSKKEKKESEEAEEGDGPRLPQKSKFVSRRVCFLLRFVFPERYQHFGLFKRETVYSWLSLYVSLALSKVKLLFC